MRCLFAALACVQLFASGISVGVPPRNVTLTARSDVTRDGWNTHEYILTPSNVVSPGFGKLGSYAVDGYIFAQPLYVPGIVTAGTQRDLLIVATLNNSVYAFDANAVGSAAVWHVNLGTPRSVYPADFFNYYNQALGVVSTPVADIANGHLFVVSSTTVPSYVLYELDLATGATVNSVRIAGQVAGTGNPGGGDCTSGSNVVFCEGNQSERTALVLANGNVYIGFAAFTESQVWHGWLFAYSATTLAQTAVFCTTPNGDGGGIWMSGSGAAVDNAGNLYLTVGNGTFDGTSDWGETILKLSPSLAILDWFTPANWSSLNSGDLDLGSGTAMLIPGTTWIVGAPKDSRVIVGDGGDLGHLQGGGGNGPHQIFTFGGGGNLQYGGTLFPGIGGYFQNTTDSGADEPLYFVPFNSASTFATTPVQGGSYGFPGVQLAGSSSGAENGILWMQNCHGCNSDPTSPPAGFLAALNPTTLQEIYNSGSGADALGTMGKFNPPLVANGRVYVATQSDAVVVYGLK